MNPKDMRFEDIFSNFFGERSSNKNNEEMSSIKKHPLIQSLENALNKSDLYTFTSILNNKKKVFLNSNPFSKKYSDEKIARAYVLGRLLLYDKDNYSNLNTKIQNLYDSLEKFTILDKLGSIQDKQLKSILLFNKKDYEQSLATLSESNVKKYSNPSVKLINAYLKVSQSQYNEPKEINSLLNSYNLNNSLVKEISGTAFVNFDNKGKSIINLTTGLMFLLQAHKLSKNPFTQNRILTNISKVKNRLDFLQVCDVGVNTEKIVINLPTIIISNLYKKAQNIYKISSSSFC